MRALERAKFGPPASVERLRFLVAEDQNTPRMVLVQVLRALGATQILEAPNGAVALRHFEDPANPVDFVFSDLSMPDMDGLELVRHLAERQFKGSLVLISGLQRSLLSSAATMARAYGIQLLGTLEKPATLESVDALVKLHGIADQKVKKADSPAPLSAQSIAMGLQRNEFEPYFQPKIDVSSGAIVGGEALARWKHPEQGIVTPDSFIAQMEQANTIDQLAMSILEQATRFCVTCLKLGVKTSVAVNVSLSSLHDAEFARRIIALVSRAGLDPAQVVFEVTETAAMTNVGRALENLVRLRMHGFGLSIDDFGTGYSSIQQLTRISFTELKIDKSFVTNAAQNDSGKAILESSIEMARKLQIKPVAEGVETSQDVELLRMLGCDLAQGYYFAKPMDAASYLQWMLKRRSQ